MIFFSSRRIQAAISVRALPIPNSVDFLPSMIVIPICLVASKTFSFEMLHSSNGSPPILTVENGIIEESPCSPSEKA